MPPDPNEFVRIKHPDVASIGGPVTRASVDLVWRHLGWTVLSPDEEASYLEARRIAELTGQPIESVTAKAGKGK